MPASVSIDVSVPTFRSRMQEKGRRLAEWVSRQLGPSDLPSYSRATDELGGVPWRRLEETGRWFLQSSAVLDVDRVLPSQELSTIESLPALPAVPQATKLAGPPPIPGSDAAPELISISALLVDGGEVSVPDLRGGSLSRNAKLGIAGSVVACGLLALVGLRAPAPAPVAAAQPAASAAPSAPAPTPVAASATAQPTTAHPATALATTAHAAVHGPARPASRPTVTHRAAVKKPLTAKLKTKKARRGAAAALRGRA